MSDLLERGREGAEEMNRRLRPLIEALPDAHQVVMISVLERGAGARYRRWAEGAADAAEREGLLACAAREEQIADLAAGLVVDGPYTETIVAPHLEALRAAETAVYGGRTRDEQLAVQSQAERVGASVWGERAEGEVRPEVLATLARCAELEEESAGYLEHLLDGR